MGIPYEHSDDADLRTLNPVEFSGDVIVNGKTILKGRVGIGGITEPEEDLEVDGSIQIDSANVARLRFQQTGQNPHALGEIDGEQDGTNGGTLEFYTKVDGGNVTEKLRINNTGAIGIGGANFGASGSVLQSNGNAASVSWTNTPTFNSTKISNRLSLNNQSRDQNIVFGWSGLNLSGNNTEHLIKTINYSQQNGGWNMMGVTIYYCIGQTSFGVPYGIGKAWRDFYFAGTSTNTSGFNSSFATTDVRGSNTEARFKLNRISGTQWNLVYFCTNSNTTNVSVEVHIQVSYADLEI